MTQLLTGTVLLPEAVLSLPLLLRLPLVLPLLSELPPVLPPPHLLRLRPRSQLTELAEEPLDLPASTAPSETAALAQAGVELPQLTVELDAKPAQERALAPALLLPSALFARRLSSFPPPQRPHRQPPQLPPRRSLPMLLAEELVLSLARALPSATAAPVQGGADLPLRTAVLDVKRHSELALKRGLSLLGWDESQQALDETRRSNIYLFLMTGMKIVYKS